MVLYLKSLNLNSKAKSKNVPVGIETLIHRQGYNLSWSYIWEIIGYTHMVAWLERQSIIEFTAEIHCEE